MHEDEGPAHGPHGEGCECPPRTAPPETTKPSGTIVARQSVAGVPLSFGYSFRDWDVKEISIASAIGGPIVVLTPSALAFALENFVAVKSALAASKAKAAQPSEETGQVAT